MKTSIKIALFVVFFIALGGILMGLYMFNKQHKDLSKAKPDFTLTATALQKAFEENETAATAKYVNKIIEVSGTIGSVRAGEGNVPNISLKTGSDLSAVLCTLPAGTDPLGFTEGKQVIIRGECSGFLMDVLLNNCILIK